jgi:hypothetical protein
LANFENKIFKEERMKKSVRNKNRKEGKEEKERTYGKGRESLVLNCTVISRDYYCDAVNSEETIKIIVKGNDEFELEQKKDEVCEEMEKKYAKKRNTTLFILENSYSAH